MSFPREWLQGSHLTSIEAPGAECVLEVNPLRAFKLAHRLSRVLKGVVDEQIALGMLMWTWHAAVAWFHRDDPSDAIDILDWRDVGDILRRHVALHPQIAIEDLLGAFVKAGVLRSLPPGESGWRLLRFGELWRIPKEPFDSLDAEEGLR